MPYYPSPDGYKGKYSINTHEEKLIRDYSGHSFDEIEQLSIIEYWLLLRDAVVHGNMQTQEGREYLDNAWRIEQTEPDRQALREKFKNPESEG
ncbi:MAG TPA: hypothetical protein DCQ90_06430 [Erysipelotrichaceae bacterium]|nr:hypothetical protein [Erysipelotrichaceae bacterium]